MKKFTTLFVLITAFVIASVFSHSAIACDPCDDTLTVGDVQINADQSMSTITDIPGYGNHIATTDMGSQNILGGGVGDALTRVSTDAYLGQEAPYDTGDIAVLNGTVSHTGDSITELTGGAGTDAFCHELSLDLSVNRESNTFNEIGEDYMNSSLGSCADFSADLLGAPSTLTWGVNVEDIDAYRAESPNGRLQVGRTNIGVSSGSFDD